MFSKNILALMANKYFVPQSLSTHHYDLVVVSQNRFACGFGYDAVSSPVLPLMERKKCQTFQNLSIKNKS